MHIIYCNFVSALQVLLKKVNIDASSPEHLEILWIGSIAQKIVLGDSAFKWLPSPYLNILVLLTNFSTNLLQTQRFIADKLISHVK